MRVRTFVLHTIMRMVISSAAGEFCSQLERATIYRTVSERLKGGSQSDASIFVALCNADAGIELESILPFHYIMSFAGPS